MSTSTILSGVGYVVGGYFGYPQLGAIIGGALGSNIDANRMPDSKLDDLKAAKVSLGTPISLLFGHPRSGGNLIWCSDAIESGEEGGKGGGPTTSNYVRHILIKLSEDISGPITRIWFGGKLVYNTLATADDDTIDASIEGGQIQQVINYSGAPDQMPDSTYAAGVGNENALAYRGCSTAALIGIACGPSGQLPPITVETAGRAAGEDINRTVKIKGLWAEADFRGDPPEGSTVGGTKVTAVTAGGVMTYVASGDGEMPGLDGLPGSVDTTKPGRSNGDRAISVFGVPGGKCRVGFAGDGLTRLIDIEDEFGLLGTSELRASIFDGKIAFATSLAVGSGIGTPGNDYDGAEGVLGYIYVHRVSDGDLLFKVEYYSFFDVLDSVVINKTKIWALGEGTILEYDQLGPVYVTSFAPPAGSGHRIFVSDAGVLCCANSSAQIYRWIEEEWVLFATMNDYLIDGVPLVLGTDVADHAVKGAAAYAITTTRIIPDETETYDYFIWSGDGDLEEGRRNTPEQIVYELIYQRGASLHGNLRGRSFTYTYGDTGTNLRYSYHSSWIKTGETPYPLPDSDGRQLTYTVTDYRYYSPGIGDDTPTGMYATTWGITIYRYRRELEPEEPTPKFYVDLYRKRMDVDLYELTEPTLQEVVEALCVRAGLTLEQIDAGDLSTKLVHSLAVSQVGPTSSTLEMLMIVYKFFCTESGGKLIFKFFGADPVRTLAYADLGATFGDPPVNALPIIRGNELELPSLESARYANIDNDYQDGLESSDRLNASTQSATVSEYAIGLTPNEAKQLVVTNQQIRVASLRRVGPFSVGPENRDLEPGDSILVYDDKGSVYQVFIQKAAYDRGVMTLEGLTEDTSAYTSDAITANDYTNSTTVRPPPETEFEILDIPLLSDESDTPHLHVVAKPERFPWSGYSFQRSPDDISYSEVYQDNSIGIFGTCSTTLAQWTGGNVVDGLSTVTVDVGAGQLSSITRTELLTSRQNLAMVGNEMLQFQTAELVTTGVYILSGFARYLGGTEWVGHGPSERFVLLKPSTLESVNLNLADYGITRYYKAVTLGRNPNTADSESFAPELVSMKPVAPGNLRLINLPNGDVLLRWVRRTRYQSNSLRGIVPLGETTEAYTVDIYDGPTLLRTISTTTTEATYTAAQQTTDGVDSGTDLIIRVRQVGALQGYAATVTQEP